MSTKKIVKAVATTFGAVLFGVTATVAVANADSVYTVQSGDTLSSISQKFAHNNSLINKIAEDNNISNIDQITVGQRLVIKDGQDDSQTQTTNSQAQTANTASQNTAAATNQSSSYSSSVSGSDAAAKAWIAARESGGNYSAQNGQYVGKYQLSASYLNGDYSAANQERVADQYVASRYGSWTAAQQFWAANGYY